MLQGRSVWSIVDPAATKLPAHHSGEVSASRAEGGAIMASRYLDARFKLAVLLLVQGALQTGCANSRAVHVAAPDLSTAATNAAAPGIEATLHALNDVCARRDLAAFMGGSSPRGAPAAVAPHLLHDGGGFEGRAGDGRGG
jgi:hypothetical protein